MMYLTREQRLLPLNSMRNTRELGGYETQEGSFTRTKCYLRGALPAKLSEEDQKVLCDYGVNVVIDLRGKNEFEKVPSPFENMEGVDYYHIDLFGDDMASLVPQNHWNYKNMGELYILMLDYLQPHIKEVFKVFLGNLSKTILFHCSAGKDRTGVIAALLMDLAGCHPYDIVKDYSESYENNMDVYEELLKMVPKDKTHYLMSDPLYMMAMLDHLVEEYGSAKGYLMTLGFSDEEIEDLVTHFTI